jgi:hypothetical protein
VAGGVGSHSNAGSDCEPEGVAAEAEQEIAAFSGGDGGVSFFCQGEDFRGVVGLNLVRGF